MDPFCYLCFTFVFIILSCLLQPCGHLLGKGWPLNSLVCDVSLCFSLSHMVPRVRCGTWLYRFLIVAFFFTLKKMWNLCICFRFHCDNHDDTNSFPGPLLFSKHDLDPFAVICFSKSSPMTFLSFILISFNSLCSLYFQSYQTLSRQAWTTFQTDMFETLPRL